MSNDGHVIFVLNHKMAILDHSRLLLHSDVDDFMMAIQFTDVGDRITMLVTTSRQYKSSPKEIINHLYCPIPYGPYGMGHNGWTMWDSDEMTIGKTHPTLLNGMVIDYSSV